MFTLTLGPTQFFSQLVPWGMFSGIKQPGSEDERSSPSMTTLRMRGALHHIPSCRSALLSAGLWSNYRHFIWEFNWPLHADMQNYHFFSPCLSSLCFVPSFVSCIFYFFVWECWMERKNYKNVLKIVLEIWFFMKCQRIVTDNNSFLIHDNQ